jgi:hypothetical protein
MEVAEEDYLDLENKEKIFGLENRKKRQLIT